MLATRYLTNVFKSRHDAIRRRKITVELLRIPEIKTTSSYKLILLCLPLYVMDIILRSLLSISSIAHRIIHHYRVTLHSRRDRILVRKWWWYATSCVWLHRNSGIRRGICRLYLSSWIAAFISLCMCKWSIVVKACLCARLGGVEAWLLGSRLVVVISRLGLTGLVPTVVAGGCRATEIIAVNLRLCVVS